MSFLEAKLPELMIEHDSGIRRVTQHGAVVWQGRKELAIALDSCCYGQSFGPEGDGVDLSGPYKAGDIFNIQLSNGSVVRLSSSDMDRDAFGNLRVPGRLMWASEPRNHGSFEGIQWPQWAFDDKPESKAKPALPALTRQAGEKYKGLGFCDGMDA